MVIFGDAGMRMNDKRHVRRELEDDDMHGASGSRRRRRRRVDAGVMTSGRQAHTEVLCYADESNVGMEEREKTAEERKKERKDEERGQRELSDQGLGGTRWETHAVKHKDAFQPAEAESSDDLLTQDGGMALFLVLSPQKPEPSPDIMLLLDFVSSSNTHYFMVLWLFEGRAPTMRSRAWRKSAEMLPSGGGRGGEGEAPT